MNTDDTPLLPHGGYRKLRSYPDGIRRYKYSGRKNSSSDRLRFQRADFASSDVLLATAGFIPAAP